MVVQILERAEFRVLSCPDGPTALQLAAQTDDAIHLLLSDVNMPNMTGPELGEALKLVRPELTVMLMSGGPNATAAKQNWTYIQKPFLPVTLVERVISVLHPADPPESE